MVRFISDFFPFNKITTNIKLVNIPFMTILKIYTVTISIAAPENHQYSIHLPAVLVITFWNTVLKLRIPVLRSFRLDNDCVGCKENKNMLFNRTSLNFTVVLCRFNVLFVSPDFFCIFFLQKQ